MLTDSLAHDLRSPVSRLRSAAHAAAETADPHEQDELLGSVIRQADSLMRILTTVLEISRSEALTGRNQFSLVRRRRARRRAWRNVRAAGRGSRAPRCASSGPSIRSPLFGHRQLLAQAVSNLVENAIRYGAAGRRDRRHRRRRRTAAVDRRGRPWAGHSGRAPGGSACGASAGSIRAARDEGAGLGLALARAIAHLHGGELMLEDNGPGLIAVLRLPFGAPRRGESEISPARS